MAGTSQLETFTAGEETFVNVAHVERQLANLWQAAVDSEKTGQRRPITRACMYNLIVVVDTDAAREQATDTIRMLTSRNPCRAIVVFQQPAFRAATLSATITAHCHLAEGGGKQMCCEQISLHATGSAVGQIPGAVLPLLESDLPTILWWQGDFLGQRELRDQLTDSADRVFFDSSMWNIGPESVHPLRDVITLLRQNTRRVYADLSWTRLGLWRQLTADFFEAPECRQELARLNRIEITHGIGAGAALRAMLYVGWIGAQLDWTPADARQRAVLQPAPDADVGLLLVNLKSDQATFTLRKHHGEQAASTVVHMESMCELPRKRAFWPTTDAALLSQELDQPTRHAVYERALAKTIEIWS